MTVALIQRKIKFSFLVKKCISTGLSLEIEKYPKPILILRRHMPYMRDYLSLVEE